MLSSQFYGCSPAENVPLVRNHRNALMAKKHFLLACVISSLMLGFGSKTCSTQETRPDIHVVVNMVQLNVAVTDNKGNYVASLRPEDFAISEDGIEQKIATFGQGDEPTRRVAELASTGGSAAEPIPDEPRNVAGNQFASGGALSSMIAGSNVFVLFDTSNYMYRGFVFAQDAIADFIRSMDDASKVAFYSYSRNLSRATTLTSDHFRIVSGLRNTVAGDDAALYNSLLLTVKDAASLRGRKAIVVFSNGPDNASSVPPEDVAELAQSTGTIIYILSTRQAQEEPVRSEER